MTETLVQVICGRCGGDGIDQQGDNPVPCVTCNETGYIDRARINIDDIMDKIQDTIDKVNDVKSVVDNIWGIVENL